MKRGILAIVLSLLTAALFVAGAGEVLSHPKLHPMGPPPTDLAAESVLLRTHANHPVAGWLVRGKPSAGVVLLLHGVRGDRNSMVGRARFLSRLGYSVLLIDLPAHGESTAERITYGSNEAEGVRTALAYLSHEFPTDRVGVIGVSLGAATLVLSKPRPEPSAVVLESMFPSIEEAVADRLHAHFGPLSKPFAPLLLWQLPFRIGVSPDQLRPIAELPSLHSPVLIASGSLDRHTTLQETQRLYEAATAPKQLWVVEGAAHVDLHAFDPRTYESKISTFLAMHLRPAG